MSYKELKNEQAIEMLADIMEPAAEIFSDDEVSKLFKAKDTLGGIRAMLKKHPKAILEIMAMFDGTPVEEYECNVMTLPAKLLELFNDPDIAILFQLQGQKTEETSSGSATGNTKDAEK